MRTQIHSLLLLALFAAASLPLLAQIHGVAPSVTSYGFGGNINPAPGAPASVTSLGPFGYSFSPAVNGGCCFNTFFPGHQFSSLPHDQRSRLHFGSVGRHRNHFGPSWYPGYSVGYAYPVVVPEDYSDDQPEDYYPEAQRYLPRAPLIDRNSSRDQPQSEYKSTEQQPAQEPVTAQPSTVLVFKDGHTQDVGNYAIVGDTLFEFSDGLTHKVQLADLDLHATEKANDDRGVEFHAPSIGAQ